MDDHSPWSYAGTGVFVGLVIFGVVLFVQSSTYDSGDRTYIGNNADEQSQVDTRVPSPLTGLKVEKDKAERPVIGIMMSNSTEARPQSGLADAGVVFEAVSEGGITRYLALFQEQDTDFIGPVRSLRPYYIDFSRAFDASVAHVGGSQEALSDARSELSGRDIDQFRYGTAAFERVGFRYAPHNVYTDLSKLRAIANQNGHTASDFTSLEWGEPQPANNPTATTITVDFSSANYNTRWEYEEASNKYLRSLGGQAHKDRETGKQIAFDNVVVLKASYGSFFRDGTTYRTVKSTGEGTAYIFKDGAATRATWRRPSETAQFRFEDSNGNAVNLNTGQTWFAVQPTDQGVTFE